MNINPVLVFGVDIGGTKINAAVVELPASPQQDPRVIRATQVPTPRLAPSAFYDRIAELVRATGDAAVQPAVAVAHPGRLLRDGTIARGTTPNLGRRPEEFDGVNPARELARRLGMAVFAENDAMSQMRFALHALLRDPASRARLLGRTVVYLGPGTGMGGGVARIDAAGVVTPITDGHLFDVQLPTYGDGTLTAEELFTGPAIARRVAAANARLDPPIEPATGERVRDLLADPLALPAHRHAAEEIVRDTGKILGQLIATLHAGRIRKVRLDTGADGRIVRHLDEPDRAWPPDDQAAVRGTSRFILGGSVGVNPVLGGALRQCALTWLAREGLQGIEILQSPVPSADAGVLGAVLAIPRGRLTGGG